MSWDSKFEWPVKQYEAVTAKYIIKSKPIELEILVPVEVQGEAVGDLMVYGWQGFWYVAHIPTKTRFDKAVPEGDWTKEQLIIWCSKVQKELKNYWSIMAKYDNENYNDMNPVVKITIKDYCLSVAINA